MRTLYPSSLRVPLLVCSFLIFCTTPIRGQTTARTASADLAQLVLGAQTIVRGQVLSARIEPHPQFPNLQTVVVTVSVTKVLKGEAASALVFRQYVWDVADLQSAAGYRKAGELLLFLNPVSAYGLTSPVGLDQGRFRILRDVKGNRFALNGRGNSGLFIDIANKVGNLGVIVSKQAREMLAKPAGRAPLDAFEETIQALARGSR